MSSDVYYRIYYHATTNRIVICTMQDFDEPHYIKEHFVTDTRYETKDEAELVLRRLAYWFGTSEIDYA